MISLDIMCPLQYQRTDESIIVLYSSSSKNCFWTIIRSTTYYTHERAVHVQTTAHVTTKLA